MWTVFNELNKHIWILIKVYIDLNFTVLSGLNYMYSNIIVLIAIYSGGGFLVNRSK